MPKYILYIKTEAMTDAKRTSTLKKCLQTILSCYELHICLTNGLRRSGAYQIKDLWSFIATVPVLGCLIENNDQYVTKDRRWIKRNLRKLIQEQADKQGCGDTKYNPVLV